MGITCASARLSTGSTPRRPPLHALPPFAGVHRRQGHRSSHPEFASLTSREHTKSTTGVTETCTPCQRIAWTRQLLQANQHIGHCPCCDCHLLVNIATFLLCCVPVPLRHCHDCDHNYWECARNHKAKVKMTSAGLSLRCHDCTAITQSGGGCVAGVNA